MVDTIATIWNIAEPLTVILTLAVSSYVFFKDPLRKWMFFGFRPTAIVAIVDPDRKEFLFVLHRHNNNIWQFPQGGLYTTDIVGTVEGIVKRELNIDSNNLELENIHRLKAIRIKGRRISEKNFIGLIKITPRIRGKGYFACIVHADFKRIEKNIHVGYALKDYKIVKMREAKKFLQNTNFPKKHPEKLEMTLDIFDLIEKGLSK